MHSLEAILILNRLTQAQKQRLLAQQMNACAGHPKDAEKGRRQKLTTRRPK